MAFDHKKILKDYIAYVFSEEAEEGEQPAEMLPELVPSPSIEPLTHV